MYEVYQDTDLILPFTSSEDWLLLIFTVREGCTETIEVVPNLDGCDYLKFGVSVDPGAYVLDVYEQDNAENEDPDLATFVGQVIVTILPEDCV